VSTVLKSSIAAAALMAGAALVFAPAADAQPAPAATSPAPTAPAAGAPDAAHGSTLFKQRCAACHTAGPYTGDPTGPALDGVIGRKAGAAPDYTDYSAALTEWGMVWTPALMDQYLSAPKTLVPGTKMVVSIADPAARADVVAFLASLK